MINWLIFSSFVLSFAMTLLGVVVDLSYQIQMEPKVRSFQSKKSESLGTYLQRKEMFLDHPIFSAPSGEGKNFAELYGSIVGESPEQKLVTYKQKEMVLALSEDWIDKKHKINFTDQIDRLFKEIENYSYWQPSEPLDNSVASDLIVAGQVFLAHTFHYQPEALREALGKTRYFARVLMTTEDLNFKRAGLSLMEKENQFMELLRKEWFKAQLIWTPVPLDDIKKYRKFLGETTQLLSYLTPPAILEKVFDPRNEPPGFCAVLKDKRAFLKWSRTFLSSSFPFEPDFKANIAALDKIQQRGRESCESLENTPVETSPTPLAAHIPYYRRLYGIRVLLSALAVEEYM